MARGLIVCLLGMFALCRADENCKLTITVDAKQVQGICQSPSAPSNIINSELQTIKKENAQLKADLEALRDEYKAMVDSVDKLDKDTASWREIIEWPLMDAVFRPDNDTLYIDPEGPTYKDCGAAVSSNRHKQGIYTLAPGDSGRGFTAYCDPDGWTVIQRRFDGSVDFYQNWDTYMSGFGRLGGEFWLGLENIYSLTQSDRYELRIEALGYNGKLYHSVNPGFKLAGEVDEYVIYVDNMTDGNFKDVVSELNGTAFTTQGIDNDDWYADNCAQQYRGAFWLKNCGFDLNRMFCDGRGCMSYGDKIIKKSVMKIRPMGSRNYSGDRPQKSNEGKKPKKPKKMRNGKNRG